ncbi:Hsp70 protein-domain-containing protein [Lactarius pseudohatsudake]|nr:Hsp70 protein-domain-containing protein [Lactarius pseudohatsudake]
MQCGGRVEIIANDHWQGHRITPSWVAFTDEERLIGDSAKNEFHSNPTNTVFGAKRLIGRKIGVPNLQCNIEHWPFKRPTNLVYKINIVANLQENALLKHTPEEISVMIKETTEAYLGKKVMHAVITIPAYFNDASSGDLGGGTIDVSLLSIEDGVSWSWQLPVMPILYKKKTGTDVSTNLRALGQVHSTLLTCCGHHDRCNPRHRPSHNHNRPRQSPPTTATTPATPFHHAGPPLSRALPQHHDNTASPTMLRCNPGPATPLRLRMQALAAATTTLRHSKPLPPQHHDAAYHYLNTVRVLLITQAVINGDGDGFVTTTH